MTTKLFELRDKATFVPVIAVKLDGYNDQEHWLLRRSGYGLPSDLVLLAGLAGGTDKATCDPYDWTGNRTRQVAHKYITKHFDDLQTGAVVDVEYILGETTQPKKSEREDS
jgi:hypothetical protein